MNGAELGIMLLKQILIKRFVSISMVKRETDCNLLIMAINQELKKINHKGYGCK